jgi:hypothetical protein
MSKANAPAIVEFKPPSGETFGSEEHYPLGAISRDLCKLAALLQSLAPLSKLVRLDDWHDHDGLYFERHKTDFHGLFQLVQSPRSLVDATPGDVDVYVGILAEDRGWYLRFRADWDDPGENLIGFYSVTLDEGLVPRFESDVIPNLECPIGRATR